MIRFQILTITHMFIVLNIIAFVAQQFIPFITIFAGMNYLFLEQGLWFQPLSSMFLHGSWWHLLMNMIVLFQFGNLTEQYIGKLWLVGIYLLGGILTSILSLLFSYYILQQADNMVGASGAISVLMGIFAIINRTYLKGLFVALVIISFVPLFLGVPVAWYAHLIGFFLGIGIGYLYLWFYPIVYHTNDYNNQTIDQPTEEDKQS